MFKIKYLLPCMAVFFLAACSQMSDDKKKYLLFNHLNDINSVEKIDLYSSSEYFLLDTLKVPDYLKSSLIVNRIDKYTRVKVHGKYWLSNLQEMVYNFLYFGLRAHLNQKIVHKDFETYKNAYNIGISIDQLDSKEGENIQLQGIVYLTSKNGQRQSYPVFYRVENRTKNQKNIAEMHKEILQKLIKNIINILLKNKLITPVLQQQ